MLTKAFLRTLPMLLLLMMGAVLCSSSVGTAAESSAASSPLEKLLKQAEFDYVKGDTGHYKVYVKIEDTLYMLLAYETEIELGDTKMKQVQFYMEVMPVPKKLKDAEGYFTRVAELNDGYKVGKLGFSENTLWYNSSFWLDGATDKTLITEVLIAIMTSIDAKEKLAPFVGNTAVKGK